MKTLAFAAACGVGLLASMALAHPLAPALLDLREAPGGAVDVRWKTSTLIVPGARTRAVLPSHCNPTSVPNEAIVDGAIVARWTTDCGAAGLVGATIGVEGLGAAGTEALVRLTLADERVVQKVLRPTETSFVVPERESWLDVAGDYARLGIEHILTGPDHLLFVLGLVLLVSALGTLAKTITAFTIGHSITLVLVVTQVLRIPPRPAEFAIALTVLAVAVELGRPKGRSSAMRRWPWLMAATFGLLHGLGFAGALREIGLPEGDIPLALFAFNLGIELGQLLFVAALLAVGHALRSFVRSLPPWVSYIPTYAMGSCAAFWCFQRAASFFQ